MTTTNQLAAPKLPITNIQRSYLENAEQLRDVRPYSPQTIRWGMQHGLVDLTEGGPGIVRYAALTASGRAVLQLDREHGYRITAMKLGGSPIKGLRGPSGTHLRCRCRAIFRSNETRARGGEQAVMTPYRAHLLAVLATLTKEENGS